jgi:hypothetical protein
LYIKENACSEIHYKHYTAPSARIIPYRVARQHCPALFHQALKGTNNQVIQNISSFFMGAHRLFPLQHLLLAKATKRLFLLKVTGAHLYKIKETMQH